MKQPANLVAVALAVVALNNVSPLAADTVQLANGDTLSGTVLSVNQNEVRLNSELLGEVKLPRAKVAAVFFGDRRPALPTALPDGEVPRGTADALIEQLLRRKDARPGDNAALGKPGDDSPEDVVRAKGLDAQSLKKVRRAFPLLGTPAAGGYFDRTLSGLLDGSVKVEDVRTDAVRARDMLQNLKKDLGPQGAALDG